MISWCCTCSTGTVEIPDSDISEHMCSECWYAGVPIPELRPDPLERGLEAIREIWARIGMPYEHNTVDLKQLREERVKRRGRQTTTSYSADDISRWLRYQNRAR